MAWLEEVNHPNEIERKTPCTRLATR